MKIQCVWSLEWDSVKSIEKIVGIVIIIIGEISSIMMKGLKTREICLV